MKQIIRVQQIEVKRSLVKGTIPFVMVFFFTISGFAQSKDACNYKRPQQADQWVFGDKAHIDFSQDPLAEQTASFYNSPNGMASISDENGNLLFFTNGITIWNKFYYVMTNGDGLKGNNFSTQSAMIVPSPIKSGQYYVFTLDMYIPPVFTDGVNYSIVNISNGNSGEVVSKNNFLFGENSQKVCAVKNENGRDYWIIFHGFGLNNGGKFFAYLLSDSLSNTPVISSVGSIHKGDPNNGAGFMKASSDGKKIALVIPADGKCEIFDFDAKTGKVSHPVSSQDNQFDFPFGLAFSPDNSKLYLSTSPLGISMNYLYQFDLTLPNPLDSPVLINAFEVNDLIGEDSLMGALQLAPNGEIYLTKFKKGVLGKKNLGVIYNPNRPGTACNYNEVNHQTNNGFALNGAGGLIGLPTFPTDFLNIPHFWVLNQCLHDTTQFVLRNKANIDVADWDFDDPAGTLMDNNPYSPGFEFSDPGDYHIQLTEHYGNESYPFSATVHIHPLPVIDLGHGSDTIYILPGSSVRLDAGDYVSYAWDPTGSTDRYLDVTQEGLFRVTVTDSNCCSNTGEVVVMNAKLQYPTAFRPESGITVNRTFKVIGNVGALADYHLMIYNRWGQQIFETKDPLEGWDGTVNGSPAERGTYIWVAVFKSFASDVEPAIKIKNRGTVTLLR